MTFQFDRRLTDREQDELGTMLATYLGEMTSPHHHNLKGGER